MFKIDEKIGNSIKFFRKKAGLTQRKLAKLLGVSFSTLRRWEVYGISPRVEEIKRLAEVLHVTETDLINEQQTDRVQITLSYDWKDMKEGEIDMDKNKFKLILGDDGQIGVQGSGLITTREAMKQFLADFAEQVEIAFDTQVRRGIIPEA